jgi:hypothetical protein
MRMARLKKNAARRQRIEVAIWHQNSFCAEKWAVGACISLGITQKWGPANCAMVQGSGVCMAALSWVEHAVAAARVAWA